MPMGRWLDGYRLIIREEFGGGERLGRVASHSSFRGEVMNTIFFALFVANVTFLDVWCLRMNESCVAS